MMQPAEAHALIADQWPLWKYADELSNCSQTGLSKSILPQSSQRTQRNMVQDPPIGKVIRLLINFNTEILKDGIKRFKF